MTGVYAEHCFHQMMKNMKMEKYDDLVDHHIFPSYTDVPSRNFLQKGPLTQ